MRPTVSVIIPVHNGQAIIAKTLESICLQEHVTFELIIIDDGSKDDSRKIISEVLRGKKGKNVPYTVISHKKPLGLAASYNEGVRSAKGVLIITVHEDMVLKKNTFDLLIRPFLKNKSIVASISSTEYPIDVWKSYPFWGKCLFDRFVGKRIAMLDGKCTCFSKKALFNVGLFNSNTYRSAGEDGDMGYKLRKIGTIVKTQSTAIHLHAYAPDFPLCAYIQKHAQLAEAQGTTLRNQSLDYFTPKSFAASFFRELLILGLFIPLVNKGVFIFVVLYAFIYTRHVFFEPFDMRLCILPFVNIWLLVVSIVYSLKGFIGGKQTI
jgi:glycosyltransferase involved in cell wall biosynthesis